MMMYIGASAVMWLCLSFVALVYYWGRMDGIRVTLKRLGHEEWRQLP